MDSVDTIGDAETIKIKSPASEWIPLRHAPFLYQAVLRRRQSLALYCGPVLRQPAELIQAANDRPALAV